MGKARLRLALTLLVGIVCIGGSAFLIRTIQDQLEKIGYGLPWIFFQAVLAGGVVYVATWAMELFSKELNRYRLQKAKALESAEG